MQTPPSPEAASARDVRWIALIALCLGELMIVLDTTIVNVALPLIRDDLGFSPSSLVWVINAYMLTYGGLLLLGGRMGDLFGHKAVFHWGIVAFTLASLACGLATSREVLVIARGLQGVGGAVVSAVALSLIVNLFPEPGERTKAMGVYGFVCAGGGSVGVLAGGLIAGSLAWPWVFLVNAPLGALVFWLVRRHVHPPARRHAPPTLDHLGAVLITASMILLVFAILGGHESGWTSPAIAGAAALSVLLMIGFVLHERRLDDPLVPLRLLRRRGLVVASGIGITWALGMFAAFFIATLLMQGVLGYTPLQVGLAFLPSNLAMAALSLGLSGRIVSAVGVRVPLFFTAVLTAIGLLLLALMPQDARYVWHILPGTLLLGIAGGIGFNPLLMAAMGEADEADSGASSGIFNTAFMMGGAVGLALLAAVAAVVTDRALASGLDAVTAAFHGYQMAFWGGAAASLLGAFLCAALPAPRPGSTALAH